LGSEFEDGYHLIAGESIEHLDDFVNREPVFQVLENGRDGNASAAEDPGAAKFAGDAFDCRAS
jgi:hypothetical protein